MLIGVIILALVAVMIFFGIAERFLKRIGVSNWLAFLLVLALVGGAVIPNLRIGSAFSLNIGGFVIPVIIAAILFVMLGRDGGGLLRGFAAMVGVAAVAVGTRMLLPANSAAFTITASVIVGFVSGAIAYIIAQSRLAVLAGCMAGIAAGDVITNLIYRYVIDGSTIALGARGVFDSLIIASVFGIILIEAVGAIKRASAEKRTGIKTLNTEASEDNLLIAAPERYPAPKLNLNEEDYEGYFYDETESIRQSGEPEDLK